MKKQVLITLISTMVAICFPAKNASAQITIYSTDMPSAGDTIRLSIAPVTTPGIDLTITGANAFWDFSQLQFDSQTIDTFLTVLSTGLIYQFAFFTSSFAQKGADLSGLPGLNLTDVYNFYGKTSMLFQQNGIGATLNGIQTPLIFTSKDVIYRFPLDFGDMDTSNAVYGISIPNLGSYAAKTDRINAVDGWGTVVTPWGSFSSLRVKSELTGRDSIYISASSQGIAFDRPLTREYKWLAAGKRVPVLQINTSELLPGNEIITSIVYRDSVRVLPTGVNETDQQLSFNVFPNPARESISLQFRLIKASILTYELFNAEGQLIYYQKETGPAGIIQKTIPTVDFPHGLYLLRLKGENGTYNKRVIISGK